jgi:hypothetical protein
MQSVFETIENFAPEVYFEFDNQPGISTLWVMNKKSKSKKKHIHPDIKLDYAFWWTHFLTPLPFQLKHD